jgi:hypothetical protein
VAQGRWIDGGPGRGNGVQLGRTVHVLPCCMSPRTKARARGCDVLYESHLFIAPAEPHSKSESVVIRDPLWQQMFRTAFHVQPADSSLPCHPCSSHILVHLHVHISVGVQGRGSELPVVVLAINSKCRLLTRTVDCSGP